MHLPTNVPESENKAAERRNSPCFVDCEGRIKNLELPYNCSPDEGASAMCSVCDLCTRRKRRCSSNGGSQCCTLCLKNNLPCFFRMKLRRGPKRKLDRNSKKPPIKVTKRKQEADEAPHPVYKPSSDPTGSSCHPALPLKVVGDIPWVTGNWRDATVPHTESGPGGGYNLTHQSKFGATASGSDTGDNVWHAQPTHKNGGLAFGEIVGYAHASHVAHPGANLPCSLAATPVYAPLEQIHMDYNFPNYFVPASQSGDNGYVQGEGWNTGETLVFSGQQVCRSVDDKTLHYPMDAMSNEGLPRPNPRSPAVRLSKPSKPTQNCTQCPNRQNVAHVLVGMSKYVPSTGTKSKRGDGATASNKL